MAIDCGMTKPIQDQQCADIESKLIRLGFGLPLNEVLGLPRERTVASLPKRIGVTMKGGRITVEVRDES